VPIVSPSCYSPAPAREISVVGTFFPLQNDLVVARQAESTSNPDQVPTTAQGEDTTGRRLFSMDPMSEATYMLVDIRPIGQLVRQPEQGPPTIAEVNGSFQGFTFAKARITWQEEGSATRSIDIDIGSGICFSLPPSFMVAADLLIPSDRNLEFLDGIGKPANYPSFGDLLFYTTVGCKVTCVSSPSGVRPCLTRQVYLASDGAPRQFIAVPPYGDNVRLTANVASNFRDDPSGVVFNYSILTQTNGGAIPASGPAFLLDAPPFPTPRAPFDPVNATSGVGRIPGGSNVVVASLRDGANPTVATATFCLAMP